MQHVFNVFGRLMAIERVEGQWKCQAIGADGKRGRAELAIPPDVTDGELGQYLYDIYHEGATPTNGDVFEVVPKPN